MSTEAVAFQSVVPVARPYVWSCYVRSGMFDRLSPPWQQVRCLEVQGTVKPGDRRVFEIVFGPVALQWVAVHEEYREGYLFSDRQARGPFRRWRHQHRFIDAGDAACQIRDEIEFELPASFLSHPIGIGIARTELRRMFRYRHAVTYFDLIEHYRLRDRPRRPVRVSGSPEDVVHTLGAFLDIGGHEITAGGPDGISDAIVVSGDFTSGLTAEIWRAGNSTSVGAIVRSARIIAPQSSMFRLARACQFFDIEQSVLGEREFNWSTVDDVVAAVHRLLVYPEGPDRMVVRHPAASTFAQFVEALGVGDDRLRAGKLPDALARRVEDEISSDPDAAGAETVTSSRYHSLEDAILTLTGGT